MTLLIDRVSKLEKALEYYAKCSVAGSVKTTGGPGGHAYFHRDDGEIARKVLADKGKCLHDQRPGQVYDYCGKCGEVVP